MQDFWGEVVNLRTTRGATRFSGNDEEAVVDQGKTSSTIHTKFEKEELESHRAVYVGVHVPLGRQSRRRHRHRGHKHHRKRKDRGSEREDGRESPVYDTPSQRVQFILGTEDDDEEHIPHDLFTELDELSFHDGQAYEWKETARWLKFEEDVEDGGERWSKPYVATLSLHSLFELRSCILSGTVMLDMRANTIEEIADMVIDNMVASEQLDESLRENVRNAMLKRHHHQNEKKLSNRIPLVRSFADIGKKHSDPHLLERNGLLASPQSAPGNLENSKPSESRMNVFPGSRENSTVDFSRVKNESSDGPIWNLPFMSSYGERLPPLSLLCPPREFGPKLGLSLLLIIILRLQQFHLVLHNHISTFSLTQCQIFHDVAYKAKDRNDLLSGIDEFLDQVTVLPPGEWDPTIRIEPPKSVPSQEKRKMPSMPNGSSPLSEMIKEEEDHTGPELQRTGRSELVKPPTIYILHTFCFFCFFAYISHYILLSLSIFKAGIGRSLDLYETIWTTSHFTRKEIFTLLFIVLCYTVCLLYYMLNVFFLRCQCSPPSNITEKMVQAWNQSDFNPEIINWSELDVPNCKKLHGEFVGPACGHNGPYIPDVLFWSVILFFTTFFLSSFLKQFKTKHYFPTKVRSSISDFAVFLTIMIMVLVDYLVGVPSPKLHVPDTFEPTSKSRGWLISPLGDNPTWTLFAAAIPALLCTILIFMDQQITAVIINRKEHKLKKGCGYHLDLLVVAVMLGVCSVMGLPWFVAATVLSISHVNSLKVESECSAPGEQPKFLGIREQRVTGFMIFVLMGLSVFMTSILKFIPMPVLYGVFLYMGVSSLKGIQFFDRIKLFGMPAKHQPDLIYLRYVPLWKVHIFTIVQLTCLVLLWVIKASAAAVVFPMMVLALVFVRKLLDFCFLKRELSWLDDLMPESKKKKEDDKKKKAKEVLVQDVDLVPYDNGDHLEIPVKSLKISTDPSVVNISDEMAKTAVWRAVAMSSDSAKVLKPSASEEKTVSIKINAEDEQGDKCVDTETSL
uniref:Solute carrier family 4 member 7 n=1 Tax=Sinocyclocheilus grahami TaxID=75366 RepID=A0A672LDG9_SINGR